MRWEYEDGRASLLKLYEKGKERQWNGNTRIDWSLDLDPENPQELPDEQISIFGSDIWNRLTKQERANLRRHLQAQQLSQFMHGEQGALALRGEDRAAGAEHGRQVLRGHPGDGRGAPRRGLRAAAPREVRAGLPDHADAQGAARQRAVGLALGHDLPRHAGADRGPGAGRLRVDPRPRQEPAGRRGQRLRHGGRGAPRGVRPHRAARLLPAAQRRRARRARGVRRRGLLPHARPLPVGRGVGDAGPAGGRVRADGAVLRADEAVPHPAVHAHRADHQGHRPVGPAHPQGLRRHGRDVLRRRPTPRGSWPRTSRWRPSSTRDAQQPA